MSTEVDLPGGHKATLRDIKELSVRQRRTVQGSGFRLMKMFARIPAEEREKLDPNTPEGKAAVLAAFGALEMEENDAEAFYAIQDATIVAFLKEWTLDEPVPTLATIGDMQGDIYDALAEATAVMGSSIVTGAPPVDFDPKPNTKEHTEAPFESSRTSSSPSPVQA